MDEIAAGIAITKQILNSQNGSGRIAAEQLNQLKQAAQQGDEQIREAFYKAGQALSYSLRMIDSLLQPDRILIAGPLSSVPAYIDGIYSKISHDYQKSLIDICDMDHERALRLLTYHAFLIQRDIDLDALNYAEKGNADDPVKFASGEPI